MNSLLRECISETRQRQSKYMKLYSGAKQKAEMYDELVGSNLQLEEGLARQYDKVAVLESRIEELLTKGVETTIDGVNAASYENKERLMISSNNNLAADADSVVISMVRKSTVDVCINRKTSSHAMARSASGRSDSIDAKQSLHVLGNSGMENLSFFASGSICCHIVWQQKPIYLNRMYRRVERDVYIKRKGAKKCKG